MKLIELHILQSFPVSCLNRDDVGAPKSAIFGGVPRARISSQCLKRAARLAAAEVSPELFKGERTRLIIIPIQERLTKLGIDADHALKFAILFCDALATQDTEAEKKGVHKVKTMTLFSPLELDAIAEKINEIVSAGGFESISDEKKKRESLAKKLKPAAQAAMKAGLQDAADIALFGRMVASDHSLTLEGAAMFSHALSTNKCNNEIDFWTAVDDRQKEDPTIANEDKAGSGGMGTAEFNSATYYRYVAINLDLLFDQSHLSLLETKKRKVVIETFIRSVLTAVPSARKNSANANTLPFEVLGVLKESGQPIQLINAFENPVKPTNGKGLAECSIDCMREELQKLKQIWDIEHREELWLTETDLPTFISKLTDHVE